jgi:hypothetical protein
METRLRARSLSLLALGIAVVVAGCSEGGERAQPAASSTITSAAAAPNRPSVRVTASAKGDRPERLLKGASRRATPELQRFLTRYLSVAFDPAAARGGFQGFSEFFQPGLRPAVIRDLASLSLGREGGRLTEVQTRPAGARVVFLVEDGRPLAASVVLRMQGSARAPAGQGALSLDSTFQMQRGQGGWKIAAYDSSAKVPG